MYFWYDSTPDYEGIVFLTEDGIEQRIGENDDDGRNYEITLLPSRLIGVRAKFFENREKGDSSFPHAIGSLGLIPVCITRMIRGLLVLVACLEKDEPVLFVVLVPFHLLNILKLHLHVQLPLLLRQLHLHLLLELRPLLRRDGFLLRLVRLWAVLE